MKGYLIDSGFRDLRYFCKEIYKKGIPNFVKELEDEHAKLYGYSLRVVSNVTVTYGEFIELEEQSEGEG